MSRVVSEATQVLVYPILEAHLTYAKDGKVKEWVVPSTCFHDLWSSDDGELAGMGLAILGNVIQHVKGDLYDEALGAQLYLKRYPGDKGIECPWPGMDDDRPLPLDLMKLPFESAMFLNHQGDAKKHVDRLTLMARIRETWVPWLRNQMSAAKAS